MTITVNNLDRVLTGLRKLGISKEVAVEYAKRQSVYNTQFSGDAIAFMAQEVYAEQPNGEAGE